MARLYGNKYPNPPPNELLPFMWVTTGERGMFWHFSECSIPGQNYNRFFGTQSVIRLSVSLGGKQKPGNKYSPGPGLAHSIYYRRGTKWPSRQNDLASWGQLAFSLVPLVLAQWVHEWSSLSSRMEVAWVKLHGLSLTKADTETAAAECPVFQQQRSALSSW